MGKYKPTGKPKPSRCLQCGIMHATKRKAIDCCNKQADIVPKNPDRDYSCKEYSECLTKAAMEDKHLNCRGCRRYAPQEVIGLDVFTETMNLSASQPDCSDEAIPVRRQKSHYRGKEVKRS